MIDVNAYLGHFAFRRLRDNTAESLLRRMDTKKISKAVVSSASAITHRNPQPANEDLAAEVVSRRDRLRPFAVLNPAYAGWEDDLKICHEDLEMTGLRLYPHWHAYKLTDPQCRDLVTAATQRGMLISIPMRVEDPRQRSWLVDVPDVALTEVAELIESAPEARFLLLNGLGYVNTPLGRGGFADNYLIEISRLSAVLDSEIGRLISTLGAERLVLGTGMPFSYPDPALLKLEVLAADADAKAKIASGNAIRWLNWE
jgi:uncharacterized protein